MTYDIVDRCSIRLAVALGSPLCGSSLTVTLPRLCRPEPALAETLAPCPLKTEVENDSDITRASQPTHSRPVECVGFVLVS